MLAYLETRGEGFSRCRLGRVFGMFAPPVLCVGDEGFQLVDLADDVALFEDELEVFLKEEKGISAEGR